MLLLFWFGPHWKTLLDEEWKGTYYFYNYLEVFIDDEEGHFGIIKSVMWGQKQHIFKDQNS
jgi:hypothetical protein